MRFVLGKDKDYFIKIETNICIKIQNNSLKNLNKNLPKIFGGV
jgi:hypothetical protein